MNVGSPAFDAVEQAFYERLAPGTFWSHLPTTGPWDPALQHGGPPVALLGRALELLGGPDGSRIARLAFDFFSPVPVAEVSIDASVSRRGARLQIAEATMTAGGRVVLRASASSLVTARGRSPSVPLPFTVPPLPSASTEARFRDLARFPYGDAIEWRFAEGAFDQYGPATVWTRPRIPLVQGSVPSGLQRVLVVVDAAYGVSATLPFASWTFVPIDLMLTAHRWPTAEWVGLAARTTLGSDGIGTTDTVLFDADGAFGRALQTLYVAPR
jgi:hypothetical protein